MKRSFTFDLAADISNLRTWPDKAALETYRFALSVKDWMPLLTATHGKCEEMLSLDGVDDPPDIQMKFESRTIGFEMTNLVPEKFARYDKVIRDARRSNSTVHATFSAPEFKGKQDMINHAINLEGGWALTETEVTAWIAEASNKFDAKAAKAKDTFEYLVMFADDMHINGYQANAVISTLDQKIQKVEGFPLSLILIISASPEMYGGWFLRKGEQVLQLK